MRVRVLKPFLRILVIPKRAAVSTPTSGIFADEEVDALFDGSIFKAIEARKQRLAMTKALDEWDK